jgi:D-alanyl-D-alanine carboxypeptidase
MEELKRKGTSKGKIKRKINRWFLVGFCSLLLIIIGLFTIPKYISDTKLANLGYSKEAITSIYKLKFDEEFIKNQTFSELLNIEIVESDFRKDDLVMYLNRTENTNQDWLMFDKLQTLAYSKDDSVKILNELEFYEIAPMFVFNNITDLDVYIADCKDNRTTNGEDYFVLDGDYNEFYINVKPTEDVDSISKLINKTYYLEEDFTPNLVTVDLDYASSGVLLDSRVVEYLAAMCDAMKAEGLLTYVGSGYRDYDRQSGLFADYILRYGEEEALKFSAKPGHSEHQTGLAMDLVSGDARYDKYADTEEYQWLLLHGQDYGFIQRYQENKTEITGYNAESWHWRYLGIDLAQKVKESSLTYDEYYALYIAA